MKSTTSIKGIHFALPVWGNAYISTFVNIALPSLLAPGNLPVLPKQQANQFHLFSRAEDLPILEASPAYDKLKSLIPIKITIIDPILDETENDPRNKYTALTHCQNVAIQQAAAAQCALILLAPDMIIADGGIRYLGDLSQKNIKAAVPGNLRVVQESFLQAIQPRIHTGVLSISSRELVQLAMAHLHPDVMRGWVDSPQFKNDWPDFIYQPVKDEGLLQHGLFHHPIYTVPNTTSFIEGMTCDGADYVTKLIDDPCDLYVIDDSDDFCFVDLTPGRELDQTSSLDRLNVLRVAEWMYRYSHPSHHHFMRKGVRIHHVPCSSAWDEAKVAGDETIEALFQCLDFFKRTPRALADAGQFRVQRAYEFHWCALIKEQVRKLLLTLGPNEPIVVYGAGEHTQMLFQATHLKPRVIRLSDSNDAKWGRNIFGLPCIPPQNIPVFTKHVVISSKAYEREIAEALRRIHGDKLELHGFYSSI